MFVLQSRRFGFKFEDAEEAHQFSEAVMVRIGARRESLFYPIDFCSNTSYLTSSVTFQLS